WGAHRQPHIGEEGGGLLGDPGGPQHQEQNQPLLRGGESCRDCPPWGWGVHRRPPIYGIKKKEEREAEAQAAMEANSEGSLTRPKKAIPPGCGDEVEEEDESILDTVIKYLPGPLQDMLKK
uniref:Complexin 1 n=1 Tax=Nomascus leucogenys TaxID=61853 RepID=A0A2I3HF90_NOMLE